MIQNRPEIWNLMMKTTTKTNKKQIEDENNEQGHRGDSRKERGWNA